MNIEFICIYIFFYSANCYIIFSIEIYFISKNKSFGNRAKFQSTLPLGCRKKEAEAAKGSAPLLKTYQESQHSQTALTFS